MNIYTAHFRYSGDDRMDITVKSSTPPGNVLAPTWDMVNGYRTGKISQWDYALQYFSLLMVRMSTIGDSWRASFDDIVLDRPQITLVCFCPAGQFCHRILAARMLENMGHGKYIGEWQL
jgi:hypothetical protein